jgi:hypothetical protein
MLRVVGAFKIVNRSGYEFSPGKRYFDEERADSEAARLNTELCMRGSDTRLRSVPCFLLEVPYERGEPTFFDLGSPVDVQRANTCTIAAPLMSESAPAASKT